MAVSTNFAQRLPTRDELNFNYQKAAEIPQQCLLAAKILEAQPFFDGKGSITKKCKLIRLASREEAKIFDIFNENARQFMDDKPMWQVHSFGCGNDQRFEANGQTIKQGLDLRLYKGVERCSLEKLEQVYFKVYHALRKGWVESNPKDYPNIRFKKNSEKYALYIKDNNISEEVSLIWFLTRKFNLNGKIHCDAEWLRNNGEPRCNKIYLWINKKELSPIVEIFGFEMTPADS